MQANTIMSRKIVSVQKDAPIAEALGLMLYHRISGLPVLDASGAVVGVLTEGDLLRRSETGTERRHSWWSHLLGGFGARAGEYVQSHTRRVSDLMTADLVTVGETTSLDDIVDLMERKRIKRVLVMQAGVLAGIVSRTDLLRALAARLSPTPVSAVDASDDDLATRIEAELATQDWFKRGQIQIEVSHGVVHLNGAYMDMRERDAVRVAAENVAGVKAVEDHLYFVDPNAGVIYG